MFWKGHLCINHFMTPERTSAIAWHYFGDELGCFQNLASEFHKTDSVTLFRCFRVALYASDILWHQRLGECHLESFMTRVFEEVTGVWVLLSDFQTKSGWRKLGCGSSQQQHHGAIHLLSYYPPTTIHPA